MSYSFLDNLWDTEGNVAYTSEQTNPVGRKFVSSPDAMMLQTTAQQQQQQQSQNVEDRAYAMPQTGGYPPEQPNVSAAAGRSTPTTLDANAELKALLRATIAQIYENNMQHHQKITQLREGRGKLTKSIRHLTYIMYALLTLCFVMALLLILLCCRLK